MNDNVRFAALRAASKLALGVTFVGCGGATDADLDDPTYGESAVSDTEGTDSYDVKGASKSKKKPKVGTSKPTACQDAGAAPSCEALLASTFADPAWNDFRDYRWQESGNVPVVAARVKDCCRADLESTDSLAKFRWECCNLLGNGNSTGPGTPMACTPWGPPVPPSMARKARAASLHVHGVA
jgi:hypothetical protein